MKKVHYLYCLNVITIILCFYVASLIPFEDHVWLLIPFIGVACLTLPLPKIYLQRYPAKAQLPNDYVGNDDETIRFDNHLNRKYTIEAVVKIITDFIILVISSLFFMNEVIYWRNIILIILEELSSILIIGIIFIPIYVSRIRKHRQSYYIVEADTLIIHNDRIAGDMAIPLASITDIRFEFSIFKSAYNPFLILTINGLPLKLETVGCGMQLAHAILYRQNTL